MLPIIGSVWLPRWVVKIWFCSIASHFTSNGVLLDLSVNFLYLSATLSTALNWGWILIWKYILTPNLEKSQLEILAPCIKSVSAVLQQRIRNCYVHTMQSCASLLKKYRKKDNKAQTHAGRWQCKCSDSGTPLKEQGKFRQFTSQRGGSTHEQTENRKKV